MRLAGFCARVVLLIGLIVTVCTGRPAAASTGGHLTLGNPTNAVTSTTAPTNYLISRAQYALSYNRDAGIINWASWHLGLSDFGSTPRGDFLTDTSLPSGWYRVTSNDYTGSGYDRGHMVPSGDRTASTADNDAVFYMTNIIPQAADNNQGPWADLEVYSRTLVESGNELYIISGGAGQLGTIAGGKVRVPARTWKIIVVLPEGSNDLARITTATRVIAVNLPNVQGIRTVPWQNYLTTVDAIEALTGADFLSALDPSLQASIEARVDGAPAPTPGATPTAVPPTATAVPPTTTPTACVSDLLISEYVEGSANNKAVELYNGTGTTINLAAYSLKLYTNGSTTPGTTVTLSGSLASGSVYVIANPSASAAILAAANLTSVVASFNGNDALVLVKNSAVVDAIGQIGNDPGAAGWGSGTTTTTDHTLRRNSTVTRGDTVSSDAFTPTSQWTGLAIDTTSGLGSHSHSCP